MGCTANYIEDFTRYELPFEDTFQTLIFDVPKKKKDVGLRSFKVRNLSVEGINYYILSLLLFNSSDYIEYISVYLPQNYLTVLVSNSYIGDLDQRFFDLLMQRAIDEKSMYTFDYSLPTYIKESIVYKQYDRTRFTNFLYLSQQAMLYLKRSEV